MWFLLIVLWLWYSGDTLIVILQLWYFDLFGFFSVNENIVPRTGQDASGSGWKSGKGWSWCGAWNTEIILFWQCQLKRKDNIVNIQIIIYNKSKSKWDYKNIRKSQKIFENSLTWNCKFRILKLHQESSKGGDQYESLSGKDEAQNLRKRRANRRLLK